MAATAQRRSLGEKSSDWSAGRMGPPVLRIAHSDLRFATGRLSGVAARCAAALTVNYPVPTRCDETRSAAVSQSRAGCQPVGTVKREIPRVRSRYAWGPSQTLRVAFGPRTISGEPEIRGFWPHLAETLCPPRETKKRREASRPASRVNQWVGQFRCRLARLPVLNPLRTRKERSRARSVSIAYCRQ
jgi:hypothetical protein